MTTARDSTMTLEQLIVQLCHEGGISLQASGKLLAHLSRDAVVSDDRMVRRGLRVAKDVVECLRECAVYVDEKGEDTNALEAFLESLTSRKVAVPDAKGDPDDVPSWVKKCTDAAGVALYIAGWNACRQATLASQDEVK